MRDVAVDVVVDLVELLGVQDDTGEHAEERGGDEPDQRAEPDDRPPVEVAADRDARGGR